MRVEEEVQLINADRELDCEFPTEPLSISHVRTGFLPDVALHQRGLKWHHESSYVHFLFLGLMCALGLVVCVIPWDARTFFALPVRYAIAVGFVWGGICSLIPYFIRNRIGQRIVVDTDRRFISIDQRDTSGVVANVIVNPAAILTNAPPQLPRRLIDFDDVVGIQLAGSGPFQANLVFREGESVVRHNLINHGRKAFANSLAEAYALAGGFALLDHT